MLKNHLHERFVVEYLTTARYNGTEAYRRVFGCTGHSAEVGASRLRKRPDVAAEIDTRFKAQLAELEAEAKSRAGETVDWLLGRRRR
jgi:phage terminase small subunit